MTGFRWRSRLDAGASKELFFGASAVPVALLARLTWGPDRPALPTTVKMPRNSNQDERRVGVVVPNWSCSS